MNGFPRSRGSPQRAIARHNLETMDLNAITFIAVGASAEATDQLDNAVS